MKYGKYIEPQLSVIVPAYNEEEYIERCLESIINQTYKALEIIVIDDDSKDRTWDICKEFAERDERVILLRQAHSGVVEARNKGISYASAKYITFVDSDDWLEPNAYEILMHEMEDTDILMAGYKSEYLEFSVNRSGRIPEGTYRQRGEIEQVIKNMIYYDKTMEAGIIHSLWNKIFCSNILKQVYHEVDSQIYVGEDAALLFLYMLKCKSVKIKNYYLYHYRIHQNSCTTRCDKKFLENISKLYNCLEPKFQQHYLNEDLMYPLEKWIVSMTLLGINRKMGFCDQVRIPQYLLPCLNEFQGKEVILYGAGAVGRDYNLQLDRNKIDIVDWVDRDYQNYQREGLNVNSVDQIGKVKFDIIIIAVRSNCLREDIKRDLIEMGIGEEKIYSSEPSILFP